MSEFTPRYPHEGGDVEASITFGKDEFYDLIYAAREAEIRFKRLRKCVRRGDEDCTHWNEESINDEIAHFKSMEAWLKNKYREAFGEYW